MSRRLLIALVAGSVSVLGAFAMRSATAGCGKGTYCPPCSPSGGYYITCWRRVPPIYACPCPMQEHSYGPPMDYHEQQYGEGVETPMPSPSVPMPPAENSLLPNPTVVPAPQPSDSADPPPVIIVPKSQDATPPEPQASMQMREAQMREMQMRETQMRETQMRESMRGVTSAFQVGRPIPVMTTRQAPVRGAPRTALRSSGQQPLQLTPLPSVGGDGAVSQNPAPSVMTREAVRAPRSARNSALLRLPPVNSVPLSDAMPHTASDAMQCSYPYQMR